MANRRIQKKRDKVKLIVNILKLSYSDKTPDQLERSMADIHKAICWMRKMTMPELLRLAERIHREMVIRYSPFRNIIPRLPMPNDAPVIDWASTVAWRPTISDVRERV